MMKSFFYVNLISGLIMTLHGRNRLFKRLSGVCYKSVFLADNNAESKYGRRLGGQLPRTTCRSSFQDWSSNQDWPSVTQKSEVNPLSINPQKSQESSTFPSVSKRLKIFWHLTIFINGRLFPDRQSWGRGLGGLTFINSQDCALWKLDVALERGRTLPRAFVISLSQGMLIQNKIFLNFFTYVIFVSVLENYTRVMASLPIDLNFWDYPSM